MLSVLVFALIVVYAFAYMILGRKTASKAVRMLICGTGKGAIKLAVRLIRIAIMLVINLITLIIRTAARPDQVQNAWAVFIERMSDVILGR